MRDLKLKLRVVPTNPPDDEEMRLRKALKCLLRVYGIRCLEILESPDAAGGDAKPDPKGVPLGS